jgi:hypothetical protein
MDIESRTMTKTKKADEIFYFGSTKREKIALKPVVSCLDSTIWLALMNWV